MNTQGSNIELNSVPQEIRNSDHSEVFSLSAAVIYGLHGKCSIVAIEERVISGNKAQYYKLEPLKSSAARTTRPEPAIWIPVDSAKSKGLRSPISAVEAEACLASFATREYYFSPKENWTALLPKLESCIRIEGGMGLAKVAGFLFVLRKVQVVLTPESNRFFETIQKLLYRELSEALEIPQKAVEGKIAKAVRAKLAPDHS